MDSRSPVIEISPNTAVLLYLGLCLFIILAIWGWQHFSKRNKKLNLTEKKLVICEFCHYAYLDMGIKKVTKCPQCQSYNG